MNSEDEVEDESHLIDDDELSEVNSEYSTSDSYTSSEEEEEVENVPRGRSNSLVISYKIYFV